MHVLINICKVSLYIDKSCVAKFPIKSINYIEPELIEPCGVESCIVISKDD